MKPWSIRMKILLWLTVLLVFACVGLTLGASLLNARQTRSRNRDRLLAALESVQREFIRSVANDARLLHEALTNNRAATLEFQGMTLIDDANVNLPASLTEIGIRLNVIRLAFYYPVNDDPSPQLRLYYDRDLGGTVQIRTNMGVLSSRLVQKNPQGQITAVDVAERADAFPSAWPTLDQAYFLRMRTEGLRLVAVFPFISAFTDDAYRLTAGTEIGRFLMEKPLEVNLTEMAHDLGVYLAVYDRQGRMGQGTVRMPDLALTDVLRLCAMEQVSTLTDLDGQKYDAFLRPLTYQGLNVGYLATTISQAYTVQQIGETMRVLVAIAGGVLVIAFLLMSAVITRMIARPLKHMTAVTHRQLQGELDARVELNTTDEYGALGQAFNRLSQQVNTLLHEQRLTIANLTQTEAALRESETFLHNIIENIPNMIFVKDASELRFVRLNKAGEALLGYSRDELLGKNDYDFFPKDEADFFVNNDRVTLAQKALLDIPEESIHTRQQGERILHTKKIPILDNAGNPLYLLGISEDITERKQAEQALRESEERLRQIASSLREAIWLRDVQTRQVLYVNPAFEELTGWTCESFYENADIVIDAIHPDDKEQVIKALDQRFKGVSFDKEHRIIHLDGRVRWVLSRIFPVRNEAGEVYRWAAIMEDITERKQAEAAVRTLNAELEQRVHERTAKLKAANKELQSFAYIVSHDLKAPLRNVTQLVNWLMKDYAAAFDDKGKQYADLLLNRVKRMDNLINGVLEYSRIGRVAVKDEPLDLQILLAEVIDTLSPPPITITLPDRLPTIVADKTRIFQIFQNLIGNAIKFMDKPNGEIAIGCADDGAFWKFRVADNGPGIDPKHYERIFQIFQSLRPRDEQESTGVGLTIVKKIVELYGGNIWVESDVGQGSTFVFTLPKHPDDQRSV